MSVHEDFSSVSRHNVIGLVTGSVNITQFFTGSCTMIRFKAYPGNSGDFFLGSFRDGGNEALFVLDAGDDTGWVPANDINQFTYRNP